MKFYIVDVFVSETIMYEVHEKKYLFNGQASQPLYSQHPSI